VAEAVEKQEQEERESAERDGRRPGDERAERTRENQEEIPEPDAPEAEVPAPVAFLGKVQDLVYYGIALILLVLGVVALARIVADFVDQNEPFAGRITEGVNGVLFVVIVLELLRTVLAHFHDSTFHLKPFLIIGIISVVRHILTVGAELSLQNDEGGDLFHRSDIELAVNALVVVALVVALVLVRQTE